ncbi:MAG: hypothetical protein AAFQ66_07845 [Pseudomonadota bacterium]
MKLSTKLFAIAGLVLAGNGASAQEFTSKYGNEQPETSIRSQSMIFFETELEKRSSGRIEVDNFFGGTIGNEREMMDQVTSGLIQGTRGGFFADASGAFNIYQLPFLVANWAKCSALSAANLLTVSKHARQRMATTFRQPASARASAPIQTTCALSPKSKISPV